MQKRIEALEQSIRSLEKGQVEIHERIDNSDIGKNTLLKLIKRNHI